MPMRQPPFRPFAAIDQGDAQRPLLRRQTSDLDAGRSMTARTTMSAEPYDWTNSCSKRAVPEEPPHRLQSFGRDLASHASALRRTETSA